MSDGELAPCPFCGRDTRLEADGNDDVRQYWVVCLSCEAAVESDHSVDDAIALWNRRTPADSAALADALIAWAADEDNVMVDFPEQGGEESYACIFCDYWDTHPPDCLHLRARALRGAE